MITQVQDRSQLKKFVFYVKTLYKHCNQYVYPIFSSLKKELKEHVLEKKDYIAILSYNQKNEVQGRVLFTFAYDKDKRCNICFFSFFDCINDVEVANELFSFIFEKMREKGINYIEGPYTPYDPDTRRGILVEGYSLDQTLFNSYNFPYYQELLLQCGFYKKIDTLALDAKLNLDTSKLLNRLAKMFYTHYNVEIKSLNFSLIDQEIDDVVEIMKASTNNLNYQEAPSREQVVSVFKELKQFLNPNYIKIAREKDTRKPLGFCLVLPDYNQYFKITKGKIKILQFLLYRNKIDKVIGKLQYVVPQYQSSGLIAALFKEIVDNLMKDNMKVFEAGTIMENNEKSYSIFKHLGGDIIKRFRIFGKDI